MVEDDKTSMDPAVNNVSDLGEMIVQIGNAKSLVNEMVSGPDLRTAGTGRHSRIKGEYDCFLE